MYLFFLIIKRIQYFIYFHDHIIQLPAHIIFFLFIHDGFP